MPSLILNRDLKRLFEGAACVTVAGLLLGLVARPELRPDMGAPRQEMGFAGPRASPAADQSAAWASYSGAIPDYVIGTDWRRPPQAYAPDEKLVVVDIPEEPSEDTEAVETRQVSWQEPAREPTSYPSTSGGVPYDADLPHPPEPPEDDDAPAG
jgi:hypothetical protein